MYKYTVYCINIHNYCINIHFNICYSIVALLVLVVFFGHKC